MPGLPSFSKANETVFDAYDQFVPEHLPTPGAFLDGHDVLERSAHVAFHRLTGQLFEERGVYDMTFGYNLARLNLDGRHPDAGYRYAEDTEESGALRAEFTPTTPFCPQSHTLAVGSFRAWNGLETFHEYELVRVRIHPMHDRSDEINDELAALEDAALDSDATDRDFLPETTGSGVASETPRRRSEPGTRF